eukprot:sb/3479269/
MSDPDLPGPDLPEPRITGRMKFPKNRKLTVFDPDIPGTPIYRTKPFPSSIPVNRGSTVIFQPALYKGFIIGGELSCNPIDQIPHIVLGLLLINQ